ncbi:MAG: hypothetical protein ACLT3H_13700 [Roseburia sp.]
MKKRIALLLGLVLTVSSLAAGCGEAKDAGQNTGAANNQAVAGTESQTAGNGTVVAEGGLKTGLALSTSLSNSKDAAADAEGLVQANVTIAAVTVDADGKIVECMIDGTEAAVNFGTDGKITSDLAKEFVGKQELGTDYGMGEASPIGKEWNEQADGFAAYCVGKTADEVLGIAVSEAGIATDEELLASCTIRIGGLQAIVAKAVNNAADMGAQAGDKLGLGVTANINQSTDGTAVPYTTATALTVNGEGKITSATIDAVQPRVTFDAAGKITSDIAAQVPSKNELGDAFGMKVASSIGKEWNEQAAAFAQYAVGKTVDEVNGIALTEGVPSDADLAASVTIHVGDFNTAITKAVDNAK